MSSVPSATPAISAVLFDLDRTLIDLERATRLGLDTHLSELGLRADPAAYAEWKRLELLHVRRYLDGHSTMHGQRRDRVREMTGLPYTDEEADAWFTAYRVRMEAELRLFDDTLAALHHIETELCVPTGIVTNMETDYQLSKMSAVGLPVERFACILGTDRLPAPKPHPDAFAHACAALGLDPGPAVVFVGDEPHTDALGAHRAGLRGVWLDRPGTLPSADPAPPAWIERITSLAELPELLARPAPGPVPRPEPRPNRVG
jgi:putative hydrolase of the HAD superfamily